MGYLLDSFWKWDLEVVITILTNSSKSLKKYVKCCYSLERGRDEEKVRNT